MKLLLFIAAVTSVTFAIAGSMFGQPNEFCREFGEVPTQAIGPGNRLVPYVFGRIIIKGLDPTAKQPRITALYSDTAQTGRRLVVGMSGNYCFPRIGRGGTLVIEVEGLEVARRSFSDLGNQHQREDFELAAQQPRTELPPGVVNAKLSRPENPKTKDLYRKAAAAEADKHRDKLIKFIREILAIDPEDFIAWSKLGSVLVDDKQLVDAENAFKQALQFKADYSPALLNYGILKAVQGDRPKSIELFEAAVKADPTSAWGFRLLGEAYLINKQGTLGVEALDKALALDPVGMAECHLLKARLYDLAGAKLMAAAEFKAFLAKVHNHPDKEKFEKYIRDNEPQ